MLTSPLMREWARNLLANEESETSTHGQTESATFLVFERLRSQLSMLVGVDGFQVLATRALKLSKPRAPTLDAVHVTADGHLCGFREIDQQTVPNGDEAQDGEAGVILLANLLGLFLTFLGPATTLRLLQDVFPDTAIETESLSPVPLENILQEVHKLRSVCERLEYLAGKHPSVADGLVGISGNIRSIATILDIFAVVRNGSDVVRASNPEEQTGGYLM